MFGFLRREAIVRQVCGACCEITVVGQIHNCRHSLPLPPCFVQIFCADTQALLGFGEVVSGESRVMLNSFAGQSQSGEKLRLWRALMHCRRAGVSVQMQDDLDGLMSVTLRLI